MGLRPIDCEDCFEYNHCLDGTNKYCIIYEETLEPFKMIIETCKAFNEECSRCPIHTDCIKTTTTSRNPIYWESEGI